jgi:signal transduction histidine kinase
VRVETQDGKGSSFTVTIKAGHAHLPLDRVGAARRLASTSTRAAAYVGEALQWLPNASEAVSPSEKADIPVEGAEAPASSGHPRPRILWADDNADMRGYVRRILAGRYDVLAVPDGLTALTAAQNDPPDLVLTDVMMPRLDGFGLLRQLRADERTHTLPVILLSARAGEESAVQGLEAGADDYLAKPFSARELLARVRTHLELARLRREWANELERANKELEAFSYSVSHDLRAPLRAIDGFSRIVLEDYATHIPAEAQRYLAEIRRGTERMGTLIDGLLKLSRLGRQPLNKRTVDTAGLMCQCMAELRHEQADRDVNVQLGSLPPCEADHTLLKQVFINLLSNALKYSRTREHARIEVDCQLQGSEQVFCVRDNGVGFDMRYADKLFGVFQRLHRAEEFEGTGVGLAIAHRVVHRHGGRIWAEAEVGKGAAFFFTLPATKQSKVIAPSYRSQ